MSTSRCLFNSASALGRVFAVPGPPGRTELVGSLQLPRLFAPGLCVLPTAASDCLHRQRRLLHDGPRRVPAAAAHNNPPRHFKLAQGRLPRDEEITYSHVQVRQEDGRLSEPLPTKTVLRRLDPRTQSLVVVALPDPRGRLNNSGEPDSSNTTDSVNKIGRTAHGPAYPVCKIVDREAELAARRERERERRRRAVHLKEMELNWAIDPHDLSHRLRKLREFLEKGFKVELTLARKGRSRRQATRDEAGEVLRRVREVVGEVPGAREIRAAEGELTRSMKLFIEGPVGKSGGGGGGGGGGDAAAGGGEA